ncbi:sodium:proton exchanger [Bailinhaonella thermotolerans]|uniref:Sodium:proton exchanger n=1 Tax=Bailinhaonella thermotolerans TaxID=1070861 RepID=A0A3A4AVE0_9ACTN|nr:sodium:proton exchanger [Bailinhaonella thermotolerans]RJL34200.1 sodium:proton exchanger [Bailinhaonella thermotolerans]
MGGGAVAEPSRRVAITRIVLVALFAVPAVAFRAGGVHLTPVAAMLVFGIGVVAAAVLLMWAAEVAREDISGALALALLALIAVLPEYAVDLYFAYQAGSRPEFAAYAAANMTGANRLLIGIGWPLVALVFALAARRRGRPRGPERDVTLAPHRRVELGFLMIAALFVFVLPLAREIAWYASIVLIAVYLAYLWRVSRGQAHAEELVGVPARLARLRRAPRRLTTVLLFLGGAIVVFASAEPFAEGLVEAGGELGIDRFLLVQWLAPLASEAPELIVACVYAWRLRGDDALGALLSSKVNQWTLLIGTMPVAYAAGGGGWALPLDHRQVEEVFLTAAQTVLALGVLLDLRFRWREAIMLLVLFAAQFAFPDERIRMILSWLYLVLGVALLVVRRRDIPPALRAVRPGT